uniref:Ig-like domain-containing protein n=1 Tax=Globodera pallida TaxID=36090 RepID=A0A183C701_GLOPA
MCRSCLHQIVGETARLQGSRCCKVGIWPEPELVWMVNDQPLLPSRDFCTQCDATIEGVECNEGDTVQFKAVLNGDPVLLVKWYMQLPPGPSHRVHYFQTCR